MNDIESLIYVIYYIYNNSLPWSSTDSDIIDKKK